MAHDAVGPAAAGRLGADVLERDGHGNVVFRSGVLAAVPMQAEVQTPTVPAAGAKFGNVKPTGGAVVVLVGAAGGYAPASCAELPTMVSALTLFKLIVTVLGAATTPAEQVIVMLPNISAASSDRTVVAFAITDPLVAQSANADCDPTKPIATRMATPKKNFFN